MSVLVLLIVTVQICAASDTSGKVFYIIMGWRNIWKEGWRRRKAISCSLQALNISLCIRSSYLVLVFASILMLTPDNVLVQIPCNVWNR